MPKSSKKTKRASTTVRKADSPATHGSDAIIHPYMPRHYLRLVVQIESTANNMKALDVIKAAIRIHDHPIEGKSGIMKIEHVYLIDVLKPRNQNE